MDVAFQMVDGDEGQVVGEGKSFGVGDAHQKRSRETGAAGDGDGVEIREGDVGLGECGADHGNNSSEMLAGSQLGNDASIAGVGGDLGGNDGAERARAALDDGGGGLVAGGFDGQDEAGAGHLYSLSVRVRFQFGGRSNGSGSRLRLPRAELPCGEVQARCGQESCH